LKTKGTKNRTESDFIAIECLLVGSTLVGERVSQSIWPER
jgi:hypothetical protein